MSRTICIDISADIDMYKIDTDDLIDELTDRILSDKDKITILNYVNDPRPEASFPASDINEELKLELFIENLEKFTFTELRDLFNSKK